MLYKELCKWTFCVVVGAAIGVTVGSTFGDKIGYVRPTIKKIDKKILEDIPESDLAGHRDDI